ncbi:MAG: RNA methyltransferase [Pseudomonadota bacterium]
MSRKPSHIVEKERRRRAVADTVWLYGLHAVRDALENPARECRRAVVTRNAADKLGPALERAGLQIDISDPRRFPAPLDPGSVHQGAALEAAPLTWGSVSETCRPGTGAPRVVLLDRVSDPHNVGAILRSAEVFGARAVIAPTRHAAPETGSLAKAASGALERQPYLRVPNLAAALGALRDMGYVLIGLDDTGQMPLSEAAKRAQGVPLGLVFGAEGPGLRQLTRETCDMLARIDAAAGFASLNVSNAAAVALYEASR